MQQLVQEQIQQQAPRTPKFVGVSDEANGVRHFAFKVGPRDDSVIIRGPTGSGKDRVAELIHWSGREGRGHFVRVNCGALTEGLVESQLFGHERGAFTGANVAKDGLAKAANGGTLFLDEIGTMPLAAQAKLLQFLDHKRFRKVGGVHEESVDSRIISATNADLEVAVVRGEFRSDLYYRLNVISLTLSPLRDRAEDIPSLIEHFLALKGVGTKFTSDALAMMQGYHWPGNVRELQNVTAKALFESGEDDVRPEHLQFGGNGSKREVPQKMPTWEEYKKSYFVKLLTQTQGNLSEASRIAKVCDRTIYNWVVKYNLREFAGSLRGEQ